jgi:hypothetical protein
MAATVGIIGAVGSVASAGSSILGGIMGGGAASKAAAAQKEELDKAMAFQQGVYGTTQTNMQPWITGGQEALGGVEQFLGLPGSGGAAGTPGGAGSGALASYNQFTKTPFYTFPLQQTTDTMDRAAAAKGMSLSGGQVASLGQYAQGYSASNFGNYIQALERLSGLGLQGSTQLGNIGMGIGRDVGTTASGLAASAGAGIMGQATGTNQAISGIPGLVNSITGTPGGTNTGLVGALSNLFGSNQTGSSYDPTSYGYGSDPTGATPGGAALQNLGFFRPLQ